MANMQQQYMRAPMRGGQAGGQPMQGMQRQQQQGPTPMGMVAPRMPQQG